MLEELKSQEIVKKVGGRFKLAALIQKRMLELLQGSRPLIENSEGKTMMEIVVQEILQDKITIDETAYERKTKAIATPRAEEAERAFEKRTL
ncbi:MAG: DNA-directed RNA polymerase subunit omega [Planctomycetes bacterium]|nr:DNA-directed RNA polymerase subunit omega [Planctomycetota bacterium]